MSWPEIRRQCLDFPYDEDEDDDELEFLYPTRRDPVEVDSYDNIEEYEWPNITD